MNQELLQKREIEEEFKILPTKKLETGDMKEEPSRKTRPPLSKSSFQKFAPLNISREKVGYLVRTNTCTICSTSTLAIKQMIVGISKEK